MKLSDFTAPLDGPPTIASAFYDTEGQTLYVIDAPGLTLYTYTNVPKSVADNLLKGPASGQFRDLTRTQWTYTTGPAPTA